MTGMSPRPVLLCCAIGLLACSACDETSGDVRTSYVDRHRDTFVFHAPRARLVEGLCALFAERGLELIEPTTGDVLHTTRGEPQYECTTEYTIHLLPTRSGTLVRISSSQRDGEGKIRSSIERYEDLEWTLAERLEPDRTLEIAEEANRRADRVAPRAKTQ
jgi:hypothetical protein